MGRRFPGAGAPGDTPSSLRGGDETWAAVFQGLAPLATHLHPFGVGTRHGAQFSYERLLLSSANPPNESNPSVDGSGTSEATRNPKAWISVFGLLLFR